MGVGAEVVLGDAVAARVRAGVRGEVHVPLPVLRVRHLGARGPRGAHVRVLLAVGLAVVGAVGAVGARLSERVREHGQVMGVVQVVVALSLRGGGDGLESRLLPRTLPPHTHARTQAERAQQLDAQDISFP